MDPASECAQLVEPGHQLGVRLAQQLLHLVVVLADARARQPQREPDPEQALLRAVVEVALEPPALGVAGRDDTRARGAHLGELRPQLGLQAGVLDREPSGGANRLEQLAILVQERVVLERGEALAAVLEHRDRAARVGLGRGAVEIDVARVDPEEQPQRRVAECARERVAHALRGRELGELDHQARHRAAP